MTRPDDGSPTRVDFSTCQNPLGPSRRVLDAAREAVDTVGSAGPPGVPRLVERIADRHGVPEDRVIVASGVPELAGLIGQSLREVLALYAQEVGNPTMTLSHLVEPISPEFRRSSRRNDLRVESWTKGLLRWRQSFLPRSASGIYWTGNPVDPDGRVWDRGDLLRLVDDTQQLLIVVDESLLPFFHDEADRTLVGSVVDRKNLLVLRSMTEIQATPGLPLAYAVTSADMVRRLGQFQEAGTVSVVAEAAALASIDDDEARGWAVDFVSGESARVEAALWGIPGLRPAWPGPDRPADAPPRPPTILVSLVDTAWDSKSLAEALAGRGLLVRECSDYGHLEDGSVIAGPNLSIPTRGHVRIGLRARPQNDLLLLTLADLMVEGP